MRHSYLITAACLWAATWSATTFAAETKRVKLGSPELTAGVPGDGPLTIKSLEAWLAKPENHLPLEVELPEGLALGAGGIKIPADNPLTLAKIELGRQLFFDTRLSVDNSISCASCHDPKFGYGKNTQFGVGVRDQLGGRNSPIAYNRILSDLQFWDGRAATLEEQAKGPIANPIEMAHTHEACMTHLGTIPGYQLQFAKIFPKEGLTIDTAAKAIASFERVLVTNTSPADYYESLRSFEKAFKDDLADLDSFKDEDPDSYKKYVSLTKASKEHPISEAAKRGRDLFFSEKANCTACHAGANFTDEKYHNLGVGMDKKEPDLGRFVISKDEKDRGAFKTPTIRNVAQTAP
ncbi:MAG TPA: cytochrome c peroxidase, partial [Pirellulaceae bacterium]|nr:cytochrome c peroxidase [Pirellulaceae bacterium]